MHWLGTSAAVVVGLVLRLLFVHYYEQVQGDTLVYGDIAKNWLLHGIYGFTQPGTIQPTLIRLPGYPLFLAVCFRLFGMEHYHAVLYVQAVVDLFGCVLIAALARNLFGSRAGMAALWLAALCPFTANYTAAPLTETLSIFCVALGLYALERWSTRPCMGLHFWLIVFALSYAILLRPDGGLLAAAICPAMLWLAWKRRGPAISITLVVLCGVCSLLPLAPWTLRNWRTFHVIQPLAPRYATDPGEFVISGFNRWYRTWGVDYVSTEEAYWAADTDPIDCGNLPSRAFDSTQQQDATCALLADYNQSTTVTPALDARFAAIATERSVAHPFRYYVALPIARVANMWLRPRTEMLPVDSRWWEPGGDWHELTFALAYAGFNLLYLLCAIWGGGLAWASRALRPILWPMLLYILMRCALLATIDNSEPRYTLECFPIVFVLAALPLSRCGKRNPA